MVMVDVMWCGVLCGIVGYRVYLFIESECISQKSDSIGQRQIDGE
jgi:hypothetical protein